MLSPLTWFKKEKALRAAHHLARRGNTAGALQKIEEAHLLAPNNADIWIQRGWALADLRRLDEAHRVVNEALGRWPENGILHLVKGEIFFAKGDYRSAQEALHRALELSGENLRIEYALGMSYLALDDPDRATQFFESSVKYDKNLVQSRLLVMAEHYLLKHRKAP